MTAPKPSSVVYLASFAALLGALSMGLGLGYSGPALIIMESDNCPKYDCTNHVGSNSTILSDNEAARNNQKSLIGSMLTVGAIFGGILGELSNSFLGRRLSLICYGIPFTLGWVIIGTAKSVTMLSVGRAITGLCCGLVSQTAPTYVVEIATPNIRGFLGTCFQVMVTIGILLSPIMSTFSSWQLLSFLSGISSVVMAVMMFFMPETPQWLLSKSRVQEAEESLKILRTDSTTEEFTALTSIADQPGQRSSAWQLILTREFLKPLALALGLMFFQQFSGINAVLFYQGDIFKKAASFEPITATIIVCVAQVFATVVGSMLVDYLGRRILLIASGVGHTLSLLLLGFYYHMNDSFRANNSWLALLSIMLFVSSFSIGFGPIPWMMIPEVTSTRVRSLIASFSTFFNWLCAFIITAYVKSLISAINENATYWMFAGICAVSCFFTIFALPETKGRSEQQIQAELLGLPTQNQEMSTKQQGGFVPVA